MTQLTEHFTLQELLASPTATAKGFTEQFTPPPAIISNLHILAEMTLEPVRAIFGVGINTSSGYRCLRLNTAIGGEPTSQHLQGKAADINAQGIDPFNLFDKIMASKIPFDQLIIEHDGHGHVWVHISYDKDKAVQRYECLKGTKIDGGFTKCVLVGYGAGKA